MQYAFRCFMGQSLECQLGVDLARRGKDAGVGDVEVVRCFDSIGLFIDDNAQRISALGMGGDDVEERYSPVMNVIQRHFQLRLICHSQRMPRVVQHHTFGGEDKFDFVAAFFGRREEDLAYQS